MQNSPQTSFMPKQPLVRVEGGMRRREPLNFALVLAFIMFFVSIAVAGGVFFWDKRAIAKVESAAQQLEDAEKLLNIDEINNYKKIDTRISTAKGLLTNHAVFSVILDFIEKSTAQNISLTALTYGRDAGVLTLSLSGQAPTYEAVYFQGETWKSMKPVTGISISGVTLDASTGIVNFTAKININESATKYSALYESQNRIRNQQDIGAGPSTVLTPSTP